MNEIVQSKYTGRDKDCVKYIESTGNIAMGQGIGTVTLSTNQVFNAKQAMVICP